MKIVFDDKLVIFPKSSTAFRIEWGDYSRFGETYNKFDELSMQQFNSFKIKIIEGVLEFHAYVLIVEGDRCLFLLDEPDIDKVDERNFG